MKIYSKKIIINIILAVLSAFCLALSALTFAHGFYLAKAGEDDKYERFLPLKSEEYYSLSSPIHAYSDDDVTAVTENDRIIFFKDDNAPIVQSGRTSLKQIKRVGQNFFFTDDGKVYTLSASDLNAVPKEFKYTHNENSETVGGTFFDTNGTYLVTVFSTNIQVYDVSGVPQRIKSITDVKEYPVAVNSTSMFYVANGYICRRDFSDLNNTTEYLEAKPDYMIADDEYVYFTLDKEIYRVSVNNNAAKSEKLTFADNTDYELGTVKSIKSLSFKNGNLLITDNSASGSVQEFKINGTTLEFTGYAVASGLTAYNRVSANATDIERYGKYVAALDKNKLTVIDTENVENYNKKGFINLFVGKAPDRFALGNGTILYSRNDALTLTPVSGTDGTAIVTGYSNVLDIRYQSGRYYLIYTNGNDSFVVIVNESDGRILKTVTFNDTSAKISAGVVCVDVFGNIYIADNTKIYKNDVAESYSFTGVKKLCSDLAGNLFALNEDGKIYELPAGATQFTETPMLDVTATLGKIKTFALNFDRTEIFFLAEDKEEIFKTADVGNLSLEDVKQNSDFKNATLNKTDLVIYTVKDGANVYSVNACGEAFTFNGLTEKAAEYPFIASLNVDSVTFYALASEKGVVLVNEKDVAVKEPTEISVAPEKAFLTTSVYAYAIPVIEKDGAFAITDGNNKIKLNKGDEITVTKAFSVLNKTFYEATANVDGTNVDCYIPSDFTATILVSELQFTDYTIEKVKKTVLYKNADLTEEIMSFEGGERVKLLGAENGALKVIAEKDGAEIIGYIAENALAENPNTMVRNVLIILAVFGSLAGTVSFFLLRKKQ